MTSRMLLATLLLFLSSNVSGGAETPEALAALYVQALNERDVGLYESLIWSVDTVKARDPEKFRKLVNHLMTKKRPADMNRSETVIYDVEEDRWYDAKTQRFAILDKWAVFPVPPEKMFKLRVTEGGGEEGQWTYDYSTHVLSQVDGTWFVVFPERFEQATEKQE